MIKFLITTTMCILVAGCSLLRCSDCPKEMVYTFTATKVECTALVMPAGQKCVFSIGDIK